jgi:hypothetical protein
MAAELTATYHQTLNAATQFFNQGQMTHSRLLLSRTEAALSSNREKVFLSPEEQRARAQILGHVPVRSLLVPPLVTEMSFLLSAKQSMLQRPCALISDTSPAEDSEEPEAALLLALQLYAEERVLAAFQRFDSLPETLRGSEVLRPVLQDYEEVQSILARFQEDAPWHTEIRGSVTVHTLMRPDEPTVTIKSEGELDVSVFQLLSLLYETDLYPTWVPFCRRARTIAELSRARKLIYEFFSLPLVADREMVLYCYGVNALLEQGTLIVVAQSVLEDQFRGVEVPPPQAGLVRAQVKFLGGLIRPLTRSRTHFQLITNFDPILRRVPYGVINWGSRKLATKLFKSIAHQATKFAGSEHERRVMANPPFYQLVRSSLEEFFTHKGM